MTVTRIVIDIRKHRGDTAFVVELVRCFCSRFPGAAEEWLVRPDQACLLPTESIIGMADEFDKSWGPQLRDRLVKSAQTAHDATGGASWVLSYDNWVLAQVRAVATPGTQVTAMHISELFKMGVHHEVRIKQTTALAATPQGPQLLTRIPGTFGRGRPHFVRRVGSAQVGPALTAEEAEQLARQVLREGGHTSTGTGLAQKDLRPRMQAIDLRAARRPGDLTSEALITNLIDKGLQEGWLKRFRRIPQKTGTETIYLVDNIQAHQSEGGEQQRSFAAPVSVQVVGQTASDNSSHVETQAKPPEVPGGTSAACRPRKHANRATEFEAMLSASRIGAMPESRERVFEAVCAILTENKGPALPLLELFKRAVTRAQESSERDQYQVEKNWPVVQLCIRRLMLWAGVLLDPDNNPISDKIGSNAKEVAALTADFRRICEAYLVEHIIEKAGGVNYDDETYYIGLTIYRRGIERAVPADELKAKADAILAFLEESGRIYLDAERVLRVKPARNRALAAAG